MLGSRSRNKRATGAWRPASWSRWLRHLGALVALSLIAGAPAAAATYKTVKLHNSSGFSEPRVAVDNKGHFWLESNAADNSAAVWGSTNGLRWKQTPTAPPGQTDASTDVDIVTLPSGRIVETELDFGGINFRTAFSDNGGKTWTLSQGTTVGDTDRPWLAADPAPKSNKVYLLFHNLGSGAASHNMFVSTSTDGGATFGQPVPVTLPPSQAWEDLQCADSGGPSNIFVAPPGTAHAGRVYVAWNTRSSDTLEGIGTGATGGCGASATGTFEINVVGATRMWVAYSDQPSQSGSWHDKLALDDNKSGKLVSYQLAPGAVDSAGNVYVVYDESLHPYPNYDGAPVKYIWAGAGLRKWSKPVTVARRGGPGHVLPHIVAGSRGNLDLAYWTGRRQGKKIHWFTTIAQVFGALSRHPSIHARQITHISSDTGTASFLMGACSQNEQTGGVQNGFECDRSADVWGIALTPRCELTITWPVRNNVKKSRKATYATTQTAGRRICKRRPG
ncbi:MAG: sialidase family protein [Solirubrobacteraceae bacterium]